MSVVSYSIKKNTAVTIVVLWFSILREITIKICTGFFFFSVLHSFFQFYLFIHYTLFYSPIFDQAQASDQFLATKTPQKNKSKSFKDF